jgi:hypothetical protein
MIDLPSLTLSATLTIRERLCHVPCDDGAFVVETRVQVGLKK